MREEATRNDWIRNNNTRLIRNLIFDKDEISKAELSTLSDLTFPTVSQAVNDLVDQGEVISTLAKSNGGRPGSVYSINPEYFHYFCAYMDRESLELNISDYKGCIIKKMHFSVHSDITSSDLIEIFMECKSKDSLIKKGILGIPGLFLDGKIMHFPHCKYLEGINIRDKLKEKVDIDLLMENDINAIAMGEKREFSDYAHIIWVNNCIGSAIVLNGKVFTGFHGCAGEIENACYHLEDRFSSLQEAMMAICSVVDVPLIAFSGEAITEEDMEGLKKKIKDTLPEYRRPKLLYVTNENYLYMKGLQSIINIKIRENNW